MWEADRVASKVPVWLRVTENVYRLSRDLFDILFEPGVSNSPSWGTLPVGVPARESSSVEPPDRKPSGDTGEESQAFQSLPSVPGLDIVVKPAIVTGQGVFSLNVEVRLARTQTPAQGTVLRLYCGDDLGEVRIIDTKTSSIMFADLSLTEQYTLVIQHEGTESQIPVNRSNSRV